MVRERRSPVVDRRTPDVGAVPGDLHARPADGGVTHAPAAPRGANHRVGDGQAQARTAAAGGGAVEAVEESRAFLGVIWGPLSSTARLTLWPWESTRMRTLPPGPACRQALSTSTPARRSVHSGGASIHAGPWPSLCTVICTPRLWATEANRSAHVSAMVVRSTGSSPGGGGSESKRASHSRSSTIWLKLRRSPPIRSSTWRYSAAWREVVRARLSSASMTLSGVRVSA